MFDQEAIFRPDSRTLGAHRLRQRRAIPYAWGAVNGTAVHSRGPCRLPRTHSVGSRTAHEPRLLVRGPRPSQGPPHDGRRLDRRGRRVARRGGPLPSPCALACLAKASSPTETTGFTSARKPTSPSPRTNRWAIEAAAVPTPLSDGHAHLRRRLAERLCTAIALAPLGTKRPQRVPRVGPDSEPQWHSTSQRSGPRSTAFFGATAPHSPTRPAANAPTSTSSYGSTDPTSEVPTRSRHASRGPPPPPGSTHAHTCGQLHPPRVATGFHERRSRLLLRRRRQPRGACDRGESRRLANREVRPAA